MLKAIRNLYTRVARDSSLEFFLTRDLVWVVRKCLELFVGGRSLFGHPLDLICNMNPHQSTDPLDHANTCPYRALGCQTLQWDVIRCHAILYRMSWYVQGVDMQRCNTLRCMCVSLCWGKAHGWGSGRDDSWGWCWWSSSQLSSPWNQDFMSRYHCFVHFPNLFFNLFVSFHKWPLGTGDCISSIMSYHVIMLWYWHTVNSFWHRFWSFLELSWTISNCHTVLFYSGDGQINYEEFVKMMMAKWATRESSELSKACGAVHNRHSSDALSL